MNRQPYSGHSIDIEMVTETAALLLFLLLKMNISDRGGKNMKSKIMRGIINGGVLAAVAALGITVYQLGTKPIAENPQEENSVQMEERSSDIHLDSLPFAHILHEFRFLQSLYNMSPHQMIYKKV